MPPTAPAAHLPPPPPGYARVGAERAAATRTARPRVIAAAPRRRRGFPLAAIPPLAAAVALIVTTAYATAYALVEWGGLGTVDTFLTGAAAGVLGSPFIDYGSFDEWLSYASFGGGWVIAIPFAAVLVTTALLATLSRASAGGRLASGCLTAIPLALFTAALTLLNHAAAGGDYYNLGEQVAQSAGGAAIVGFLGGLLGALLSLALAPPPHRLPSAPAR